MDLIKLLKAEMDALSFKDGSFAERDRVRARLCAPGIRAHMGEPHNIAKTHGFCTMLENHEKHIYENDLIAGSMYGLAYAEENETGDERDMELLEIYRERRFSTNGDHYGPDYTELLAIGVGGILRKIAESAEAHKNDDDYEEKAEFLTTARMSMEAFSRMICLYGKAAEDMGKLDVAKTCYAVAKDAPESFREALQLVWLVHLTFLYEGRFAMALGRFDQYLYPFYRTDIDSGKLTREEATRLVASVFMKIGETRSFLGFDDVVNIAIGGVKPEDGEDAINEFTYVALDAVRICNIPGPNLSARLHGNMPDRFIDECLKVIGTGLGYPALMNDDVNIPALARHGYDIKDARNYCMVGCIENFVAGKQPPWSDGRFNTPEYLYCVLSNGRNQNGELCMLETGTEEELDTMEKLVAAYEEQLKVGASSYISDFYEYNTRLDPKTHKSPFLSCFCDFCIERAQDINDGGSKYPSVHGACCMGIATVANSLAAIEKVVYLDRYATLGEVKAALDANFEGYEDLRAKLIRAPKYGNDDDFVDKYAVWFVEAHERLFAPYRTPDGGAIYTGIASNTSNIGAGERLGATPDGRLAGTPISDAASPMGGTDKNGPSAAVNSVAKPDYRLVSCGTVLNQKYSPEMFSDPEKRHLLGTFIRTYFKKGGQELQINSVSRETLTDAMEHPENYGSLVVRVSGFSAYYTNLERSIQQDILNRTEHSRA